LAVAILALLAGGSYLVFVKNLSVSLPEKLSPPIQTLPIPSPSVLSSPDNSLPLPHNQDPLISEIRKILKNSSLDLAVEERGPISIYQRADVTRDVVPELLIDVGSGGAYTQNMALFRLEDGKLILADFKRSDGETGPIRFLNGASVRNGTAAQMLPEKDAIYQVFWHTDDEGKSESCRVEAYRWNEQTRTFDFNSELSKEIQIDFCKNPEVTSLYEQKLLACNSIPNNSTKNEVETGRLFINLPKDVYPDKDNNLQFKTTRGNATAGWISNAGPYGEVENVGPGCWSYYYDFEGNGELLLTVKSAIKEMPDYKIRFVVSSLQ